MLQAFTICSNNYLAQAKTLADSVVRHNPECRMTICLCDRRSPEVDYSFFAPHEIIEVADTGVACFDDMRSRYGIVELNTAIKPFVFQYLFRRDPQVDAVIYLDPDTAVFAPLAPVTDALRTADILLTPHILSPIEFDGFTPTENYFTNYGIYNLGFLALKRSQNADTLLDWWARRLAVNCYIRPAAGIFVDQLPMNYAPLFFEGVAITRHAGINIGPWNLHERKLAYSGGAYRVNGESELVLYHFSNYNPQRPDHPIPNYTRDYIRGETALQELYAWYQAELLNNRYDSLSRIECVYLDDKTRARMRRKKLRRRIKNAVKDLFGSLFGRRGRQ